MNWDQYHMNIARAASEKSKDRSIKVGCVIVGPDNEIRSTGYNNFPRGINDDIDSRHERPIKYKWTEHAERNAIYNAARVGIKLKGCVAYIQWYPCADCARALINSGIKEIVIDDCESNEWKNDDRKNRWVEDIDVSIEMLNEAGVKIRKLNDD